MTDGSSAGQEKGERRGAMARQTQASAFRLGESSGHGQTDTVTGGGRAAAEQLVRGWSMPGP